MRCKLLVWLGVMMLGLLALACADEITVLSPDQQAPAIDVTGSGTAFAAPDVAVLSLGVEAEAESVGEARTQAAEAMDAMLSALRDGGVADEDIQTTRFSVRPRYNLAGKLEGFVVNNIVTAKIRSIDDTGELIDAALAAEQSPTVPAAVLASAAALRLVGRSDQAEAVLSRHLSGLQWDRTVFPYENAQWNRSLYRFCTGEGDWAALEGAVGRWGPEDPTWLLAQAYFFSGVGRLAQGDRDRAAERFRQCVKTYDYERYSFLAQTLLVRMETSPGWPAWLSGDGPSR